MSHPMRARLRALTRFLAASATARRAARIAAHTATAVFMVSVPVAADPGGTVIPATNSLTQVITNLQVWIMGILWSVAGLFAVLGAVYRMTAGGDTEQVTAGNRAFKNALLGAALAVLAPILLEIVKGIVGG